MAGRVLLQLLLAVVACTTGAAAPACGHPRDCNMAGNCVAGACVCAAGFVGDSCQELRMEAYRCGSGGLCLSNGTTTWGGSIVEADDGSYHMFAAMMTANQTLQSWLTNSVVLHATAPSGRPQGPYTPAGVALAPRSEQHFDSVMIHNPDAQRAPDGTYLIFYDGSSAPPPSSTPGTDTGTGTDAATKVGTAAALGTKGSVQGPPWNPIILRQRIGLATSTSPFGPWTRRDTPVLEPTGVNGTWDQLFVTNPAVYVYPNASALLIYKAGRTPQWPSMYLGVAFAKHYTGPYERLTPRKPIALPSNKDCEDPGIYYDRVFSVFRMILHCGCSTQMLWSTTGIQWELGGPEQESGWCSGFNYTDGTAGELATRQRPLWVVDKAGQATHLTTGVNRPDDSGMGHTWTMVAKLND